MDVLSVYRGARISAFKARELTREIQGLAASAALDLIAFSPKKAALLVGKTLKSAIANAENNNELKVDTLVVKEATVGEGPTMKRSKSRARGSSSMIRKRTAHIRIVLSDEIELPQRKSVSKSGAKKFEITRRNSRGREAVYRRTPDRHRRPGLKSEVPENKNNNAVPIRTFASFNNMPPTKHVFEKDHSYTLEVGLQTDAAKLLSSLAPQYLNQDGGIRFDVLLSYDHDKFQVTPEAVQYIVIHDSDKSQVIKYQVIPKDSGRENLRVNFFYRGSWADQLMLKMDVLSSRIR